MAERSPVEVHELAVRRTARVAVLGHAPGDETWLALHGYGQLAERFVAGFRPALHAGRAILAPEGLSRFYTARKPDRVGATWMTREARESEIRDYLAYLDEVMDQFAGSTRAIEVHGFSQGTATALRWVAHTGRTIGKLVLWGGGVPPELDLRALRSRQSRMAWHVCVGRSDEYISEEAIAAESARLAEAGIAFQLHRFEGGHVVDAATLAMLAGPAAPER